MEIAVWSIAAIFALNALIVLSYVAFAGLRRFRVWREIRLLEALYRAESYGRAHERRSLVRRRSGDTMTAAPPMAPPAARRPGGRVAIALGLAAMVAWAAVAVVGAGPRGAVDRAVTAVIDGLRRVPTPFAGSDVADRGGARSVAADRAVGPAGPSEPSAGDPTPTGSTGASAAAPTAPTFVNGQPTSPNGVRLTWAEVEAATSYEVDRSDDGRTDWITIGATDGDDTSFVDPTVDAATTYYYRVAALVESGDPVVSGSIPVTTPPTAPSDLTATVVEPAAVELAWAGVEGATAYRLERSLDGVAGWSEIAITTETGYVDRGVPPETTASYRVIATYGDVESLPSAEATITTPPASPDGVTDVGDGGSGSAGPSPGSDVAAPTDGGSDAVTVGETPPAEPTLAVVATGDDGGDGTVELSDADAPTIAGSEAER